nr:3947_t:CDS:10 [Entrophospora candida]
MSLTDHQTAIELHKSSVELETQLRSLSKHKSPFDKQIATLRSKLRDTFVNIIFLDYEFAQSREVEANLWKYVYYKAIEDFRKKLRAETTSGGKNKLPPRRLTTAFRSFLYEATGFYYFFIQRLAIHFELRQLYPLIKKYGLTIDYSEVSPQLYSDDIKKRAIISCHKSLIFLGDLGKQFLTRKNWSTACDYYTHARYLIPESGNPHNQLAVIANYESDNFSAVYHYYRSLAVKHPFMTAKDNISLLFNKAMKSTNDQSDISTNESNHHQEYNGYDNGRGGIGGGRRRFSNQRQSASSFTYLNKPKISEILNPFFNDFIKLHSVLYLRDQLELYPDLKMNILNQLKEYILTRILDSDQILKITAINMSALFVIRYIINGENGHNNGPIITTAYSRVSKKMLIEKYAVLLVLDTLTTLLDLCVSELEEVSNEKSNENYDHDHMGENIAVQILPAPVKRSLPSLRIGTKWILANLQYLSSMTNDISKDSDVKGDLTKITIFWEKYAKFMNLLEKLFPHEKGIPLSVPLKEDFEMNGFYILKNYVFINNDQVMTPSQDEPFEDVEISKKDQVMTSIDHQNEFFEKYDPRIYDVFDNSCELAESEPCYFNDVFNTKIPSAELGSDINVVDNNHVPNIPTTTNNNMLLSSNIPNGLNRDTVNNNDGGNNNTKINNQICIKKRENLKLRDEDLAKEYGLDRSTITKILKQREKWLAIDPNSNYAKQKTQKSPKFPQIEDQLAQWLASLPMTHGPVSDAQLQEKALEFAQMYGIRSEFQASNGWISKFKNRHPFRPGEPIATPEISLQTVNPTQSITGNPVLTPSEHSNFNNTMNLTPNSNYSPSPLNTSSRTNGATGLTLNNASNSSFIAFGASSPSPIGPYTPSRIYPVPTLTSTILLDNSAFIFCDYQNDVIGMFHTTNVLNQFLARSKNLFNAVHTAKQKKKLHCISIGLSFRPNYPEVSPNNRYFENYKNSGRLVEGTKGAEFIDGLQPREHDIVIQRRRVDAFYNTDLQMILESLNIKHIILAGISTADVILSTSLSAADRDLCVTVVRECCFEGNDLVQNVLMDEIFPKQGVIVAPFQDIIDTLRSA